MPEGYGLVITSFILFTIYYLGSRGVQIGFDTFRYEATFSAYENSSSFFIRKDPFFDYLTFIFSKFLDFKALLLFCSTIYILGAFYAFRLIFKEYYYLPFLVFLIYPYFMNMGINVIRSGVSSSLFLVGIGVFYRHQSLKKALFWISISIMFHISMLIPLLFFICGVFLKNTKIIFIIWLISIIMAFLGINVIANFISIIANFTSRIGNYAVNDGGESSWINFIMFGFFPVIFAVYFILIKKYKDNFYTWLVNAYMLIHIPYIILINTQFASRIGYLAEFMMPLLLMYPLLIGKKTEIHFFNFKLCILIFIVFLVKGYKVLIV